MSIFFVKDGEPFIPEAINPDLAKLAKSIVKTCRLSLKLQMRTNGLNSALKSGDIGQMKSTMLKCIEKNKVGYNADMSLTGVKALEIDDSFFDDKGEDFYKQILAVLIDMAAIRTVVDAKMGPLMSAACEKVLNVQLNKIKFFVNQDKILGEEEAEEEAAEEE